MGQSYWAIRGDLRTDNSGRAAVKSEGVTAIVATHDPILIDLADRVIELRDGVLIEDSWAS